VGIFEKKKEARKGYRKQGKRKVKRRGKKQVCQAAPSHKRKTQRYCQKDLEEALGKVAEKGTSQESRG